MDNEQIRKALENAGYRVTSNMGFEDDQQVIVSYSARNTQTNKGVVHTQFTLYELAEYLGISINQ